MKEHHTKDNRLMTITEALNYLADMFPGVEPEFAGGSKSGTATFKWAGAQVLRVVGSFSGPVVPASTVHQAAQNFWGWSS